MYSYQCCLNIKTKYWLSVNRIIIFLFAAVVVALSLFFVVVFLISHTLPHQIQEEAHLFKIFLLKNKASCC
jgi:hypothetical protein